MNIEEIEKFLNKDTSAEGQYVKIAFKKREAIYGLFIKEDDFGYLKSKNLWRIVPQSQFEAYKKTRNVSHARIFNGTDFSRLITYQESFD